MDLLESCGWRSRVRRHLHEEVQRCLDASVCCGVRIEVDGRQQHRPDALHHRDTHGVASELAEAVLAESMAPNVPRASHEEEMLNSEQMSAELRLGDNGANVCWRLDPRKLVTAKQHRCHPRLHGAIVRRWGVRVEHVMRCG